MKKDKILKVDNKIINDFISIPNVVVNSNISILSKYLYGYVSNLHYYGGCTKSINDLSNVLCLSVSSTRKCIKELINAHFVYCYWQKGNIRHIVPLVSKNCIIDNNKHVKKEIYDRDFAVLKDNNKTSDDCKQFLIDFASQIV